LDYGVIATTDWYGTVNGTRVVVWAGNQPAVQLVTGGMGNPNTGVILELFSDAANTSKSVTIPGTGALQIESASGNVLKISDKSGAVYYFDVDAGALTN
jgi:hypothetical protein